MIDMASTYQGTLAVNDLRRMAAVSDRESPSATFPKLGLVLWRVNMVNLISGAVAADNDVLRQFALPPPCGQLGSRHRSRRADDYAASFDATALPERAIDPK